ncbi:K02A2.6-like [Cordylochernes scorpioides]|uniref:RNA-directed DNA polymerase n=1 Tax=Cordylochernes scorpioides TaxID=51811 RepID=A0ABY6LV63_9ARAC|nr:K02A2.6-like [Cordylochernes scorpioides]
MAQIQPPETFDFSTLNEWPKWRKRFERYLVVSGMKKKEEADKIDLFMYLMVTARMIYSGPSSSKRRKRQRKLIPSSRLDEFITSLYKLADSCEFEGLHEQLIRDRIVVGVRDKALSERMQLDSELTLEKAVKMVRQQEAVRQQQVDLQRPSTSQKVNQVKFNSKKQSPKQQQQPSRKKEKSAKTRSRCPKCGGFTHRKDRLAVLKDKMRVQEAMDSRNPSERKQLKFKLDSQADVTCVPLCLFKKIVGQQRLVESDINIRAAEFSELQTVDRNPYEIVHIPGKELLDADALSRQPLLTTEGDEMLTKIFEAQQEDTTLKAVVNYRWPDKKMSQALLSYWHFKDELGVQNGLLMRSCRLVIPASMKLEILDKLHAGHFGITKTRLRVRETVWWPGISEEIEETVRKCSVCIQEAVSKHEPLIPTNFPTRPWQKIGMDLFKFENKWYQSSLTISRFPEMIQLDRLTANMVERSCKSIFVDMEYQKLLQYGFTHVTSSPRFPQSNGMAEAGVKIAKLILKKNQDPSLGLLEYRSTPLENGYSPAELLMERKQRPCQLHQRILIQDQKDYRQSLIRSQLYSKERFSDIAIKFRCDKFNKLVYGKNVDIEKDHYPLETIFKKPLSKASFKRQRIFLQMQQNDLRIKYKKGKEVPTTVLLSRDCSYEHTYSDENFKVLSNHHTHSRISQAMKNFSYEKEKKRTTRAEKLNLKWLAKLQLCIPRKLQEVQGFPLHHDSAVGTRRKKQENQKTYHGAKLKGSINAYGCVAPHFMRYESEESKKHLRRILEIPKSTLQEGPSQAVTRQGLSFRRTLYSSNTLPKSGTPPITTRSRRNIKPPKRFED